MPSCTYCKKLIPRKEFKNNKGFCDKCVQLKAAKDKARRDLMTSFAGTGKRGFAQWLRKGAFLQGILEDGDIFRHNDRIDIIDILIDGKWDELLGMVCNDIMELAKDA